MTSRYVIVIKHVTERDTPKAPLVAVSLLIITYPMVNNCEIGDVDSVKTVNFIFSTLIFSKA